MSDGPADILTAQGMLPPVSNLNWEKQMDVNFSKEELLLKNSVREYIRDRISPGADDRDREGPIPADDIRMLLMGLEPFGYLGSLVPATSNGPGLSHVETGIIYRELAGGWAALSTAALSTSNVFTILMNADDASRFSRLLPDLLSGNITGAVAVTEPGAGTDTAAISATACLENGHYVINGEKTWVSNGGVADVLVVEVNGDDPGEDSTPAQYILVEKDISPFYTEEIPKMGLKGLSTARLVFDRCRVPAENLMGPPVKKLSAGGHLGDAELCLIAAMAVGIMAAALDKSVSYAKERMQFGKPLGQFQMIQKMIAEMATNLDAASLLCFRALKMLDGGLAAAKEIAMAKSFALKTAVEVTSKAIQVYGAYGYSDEFPMERYYRDACCLNLMGGIPEMHDLQIAEAVTGLRALT
jgi:acyl-CoA dehydrogenase